VARLHGTIVLVGHAESLADRGGAPQPPSQGAAPTNTRREKCLDSGSLGDRRWIRIRQTSVVLYQRAISRHFPSLASCIIKISALGCDKAQESVDLLTPLISASGRRTSPPGAPASPFWPAVAQERSSEPLTYRSGPSLSQRADLLLLRNESLLERRDLGEFTLILPDLLLHLVKQHRRK
jgi:hypothetical protein